MKKTILLSFASFLAFGLLSAQTLGTRQGSALQLSKTELGSLKDVRPLLSTAEKGRDYSGYVVESFKLTFTITENRPSGVITTTFIEPGDGEALTENQRMLIQKYAKAGMVLSLTGIVVRESGKPGTPYQPEKEVPFSVPDVSITVTE